MIEAVRTMIDRARDELSQLVRRGLVRLAQSDGQVNVEGYDGESFPNAEMWGPFGITSRPPEGAEALFCVIDADGIHPICFAVNSRTDRPTGLGKGDAVLYAVKSGSDQATVQCTSAAEVKIGGLKLGTYGATPVAQQSVAAVSHTPPGTATPGAEPAATNAALLLLENKINEIRTALVNLGLLS